MYVMALDPGTAWFAEAPLEHVMNVADMQDRDHIRTYAKVHRGCVMNVVGEMALTNIIA